MVTLLLVVSLSGSDVRLGQLRATLGAQLDANQVRLAVRRADGVPQLEQLLDAAAEKGPVAWVTSPRRGRFELRVALRPNQWVSRSFNFAAGDPVAERNRTVALAIATMTPDWRRAQPLPEVQSEPEQPVLQLGEDDAAESPVTLDAGVVVDAGQPVVEVDAGAPVNPAAPEPPPAPSSGLEVDLGVLGGTWPLAVGGQLGASYCGSVACLGLMGRGQHATVDAAQAGVVRAAAHAVGRLQTRLGTDGLRAAVQLSVGAGWVQAQRDTQVRDRWQLEVDVGPELSVRAGGWIWLFVRASLGLTAGATPLFVNDVKVSELPIAAGQLTVGVRVGR